MLGGAVRNLALLLILAACQAPPAIAVHPPEPLPPQLAPPEPDVVKSEPPPVALADAGPPGLEGEPIQTWRVGNFDVVASVPVGAHGPRPVVVGIHGSKDRPETACARWRKTLAGYAFVVCPAGVPYRGGLAWGSPAIIAERIDASLAALRSRYGAFVADGPVVYAGWSLGATRGPGVVARRPGMFEPVVLAEAGHTRLDASTSVKSLRAGKAAHVIVACATKRCASFEKRLAAASKKVGPPSPAVSFVDAGIGRGHVFDDRMALTIGTEIAKTVATDPRWSGLAAALEAAPADTDAGAPLPRRRRRNGPMKRSTIIGGAIFALAVPALAVIGVSHNTKSAPEYLAALAYASQQPDITDYVGQPMTDGPFPSVKWPMSSDDKPTVTIEMTLKGPTGKGTLQLTEVRHPTGWQVTDATWYFNHTWKKLPLPNR